ncbi:MAG TPA: hypothetical protein VGR38_06360 [Candidatus Polarisedimenticolia bacterium]|nr:hypothetical protein [Candidatus Polarisedimenticolia bacterium]
MTLPARTAPQGIRTSRHAALPSLFLLALAVLLWPPVLRMVFPLHWQIGNVAPFAFALSLTCGVAAGVAWTIRRRVAATLARIFPTWRSAGLAALAVLLALVAFLGVSEVGLRVFHYPFRLGWTPAEYRISRFDPLLGWSYIPDLSTVQRFGSAGRPVGITFDSMGTRVAAPGVRHDPAKPTLLFAGCSYTFGHGLPFEETFVGRLSSMPGFPYQAINLGVQGYGTDQSLLSLQQVLPRFNTKVVVYTFLLDHVKRNDNSDRRFIFPKARFPGTKPRFALGGDGTLHKVSEAHRYDEILDCHLCDLLELFWTRFGPEPSIELTRALVRKMKEYVESKGAVFVLVLWTSPHRMEEGRLAQMLFPGTKMNAVDIGAGAPPAFGQWMIPGETHPDARAHAYAAERIAAELRKLGLIPAE